MKLRFYSESGTTPSRATEGSAGFDISANESVLISPHSRVKIKTGLYCEIPDNYEGQIRNRSGLSYRSGVLVIQGTIDSDYRGEICVVMHNLTNDPVFIDKGMRIAQMVIARYEKCEFVKVESRIQLENTERGEGGFGSTGY